MRTSSSLCALTLLLAMTPPARAQQPPGETIDPWLTRAGILTGQLERDGSQLSPRDRVMLWARLAEVWWAEDEARARGWLRRAVEEVERRPLEEAGDERRQRLDAARRLMGVVPARDRELGERLKAVLTEKSERLDEKDYRRNAEALADAAMEALKTDPRRAYDLGLASLRAGVSYKFGYFLSRLYRKDEPLAVALFDAALASARATDDAELLGTLAGEAFPHKLYFPPLARPLFRTEMMAGVLRAYAEAVLRPPATPEAEEKVCVYAWTAGALVDQYAALLPHLAEPVRQVAQRCRQRMPARTREVAEDHHNERGPTSAEDYLRAASETADDSRRSLYLSRAAYISFNGGDPDRAVEIIEGMTAAEREKTPPGLWESWRWTFAAASALKRYERGDLAGVREVFDAVPAKLRAFTLIDVMTQLKKEKATDRQFVAGLLDEARSLLAASLAPDGEKPYWWLALARRSRRASSPRRSPR
jgi:hypothetical protein